jgi:cell division topological specificity factor
MMEFLARFDFLSRLFGSRDQSGQAARERLRAALVGDRTTVAPQVLDSLKRDLVAVIERYMDIDVSCMRMGLERHEGAVALAANVPVRSVHRQAVVEEVRASRVQAPPPASRSVPPPSSGEFASAGSGEILLARRSRRRRRERRFRSGESRG